MFSLQTLELPSTNAQEISSMLDLQLGKLTPYPRADIRSAAHIVGSLREGYTTVLLAIARKTVIDAILQVLKAKGLSPRWIGVSSEGLAHWWRQAGQQQITTSEPEKLLALIDVDRASTDCTLLSRGTAVFSHSVAIGREQLGLSAPRQPSGQAGSSEPDKARWAGEFTRLPRVLLHEDIRGTIGQGVLCAPAPGSGALAQQLAGPWGVPVDVAEPLSHVTCEPSAAPSAEAGVSWTALLGFLLHGHAPQLDLIPQETRTTHALQARARQFARLVGSLAIALLLIGVLYLQRVTILRRYLGRLTQELSQVERQGLELHQMQEAMRAVRWWLDPSRSTLALLTNIAAGTNAEIVITQVAVEEGKPVTVRGRAQSTAEAFAFFKRLEATGAFATVQSTSVAKAKGADAQGADFEVLCTPTG
jgi:Tfp pilus assembly protein PilN